MVPATQVPDPVQPIPPHCDHCGRFPAGATLVVADTDVDVVLVVVFIPVEVVVFVPVEVVVFAPVAEEELRTTPPGPATLVVKVPFSM